MACGTKNYVWSEKDRIGDGTFSSVYKGRRRDSAVQVAIKVCSLAKCRTRDGKNYIEDIERLKKFDSPYITKYFTWEKVENSHVLLHAIVMELADGSLRGELEKEENRIGLPKEKFFVLVDNCVNGLEYLDGHKLSHRDIRPENILFFRKPKLTFKFCDFGLSIFLAKQDESIYSHVGTAAYMPSRVIEQWANKETITYTKDEYDVWATACSFFEAATGRLPFLIREKREYVVEMKKIFENRDDDSVCGHFDNVQQKYVYPKSVPVQHSSYTRKFRTFLSSYFQKMFSKDKRYVNVKNFSELSRSLIKIKDIRYYCLNTSTEETFCDTMSQTFFPRKTFLDEIEEFVQRTPGSLDDIHSSVFTRKVREAFPDETDRMQIPPTEYKEPLVAVLLPPPHPSHGSSPYCVATLSNTDTNDGVRLEIQNNAFIEVTTKKGCNLKELVEEETLPFLEKYLESCTDDKMDADDPAVPLQATIETESFVFDETSPETSIEARSLDSDVSFLLDSQVAVNTGSEYIPRMETMLVYANTFTGQKGLHAAAEAGDLEIGKSFIEQGDGIEDKDKSGQTPLHYACREGYQEFAAYLLDQGADVSAKRSDGWTPLMVAAENGKIEVAKLLLNRGANPNDTDENGFTALHKAACCGSVDFGKLLVESEAIIAPENVEGGSTPLHTACRYGHSEFVRYLLDSGADINVGDSNNCQPLLLSAYRGHVDTTQLLISRGAHVDHADNDGDTALIEAARYGHLEVVEFLLRSGANVGAANKDGYTALHRACEEGHRETVSVLIESGADVDAKTSSGLTPLMIAGHNKRDDVVALLIDQEAKTKLSLGKE